jgi:hypothetical protein
MHKFLQGIVGAIQGLARIDDETLASAMAAVTAGPLKSDDKSAVVAALNLKLCSDEVPSPSIGTRLQKAELAFQYFTAADWAIFEDASKHISDKISTAVQRWIRLGMLHPTEKTFQSIAVVICRGSCTTPQAALALMRELKKQFRSIAKVQAQLPAQHFVEEYPADVKAFKEKHPELYSAAYSCGKEEPVAVSDEMHWRCLCASIPMRSTKSGCSDMPPATISSRSTPIQKSAMAALMNAVHSGFGSDMLEPSIGLRLLKPQQSRELQPSSPGSQCALMQQQEIVRAPSSSSMSQSQQLALQDVQHDGKQQAADAVAAMVSAYQSQVSGGSSANDRCGDDIGEGSSANGVAKSDGKQSICRKRPASSQLFKLGCSKCRYSERGCKQCKRPEFGGQRAKKG